MDVVRRAPGHGRWDGDPNEPLTLLGALAVAAYFAAKLSLGREVNGKIQKAMQSNAVQISGNKASFGNPLRIRVPK